MNLRDQPWKNAHTWCRELTFLAAKASLMLGNPFLVPSLYKLNHISLCFIQISTKSSAKLHIPFRESTVIFLSHPRCFWSLVKFQTARVSKLPACDYASTFFTYYCVITDYNSALLLFIRTRCLIRSNFQSTIFKFF